ncbi:MAG: hypothetical protein ACREQ5_30980 [Candidatus Dormibacteria bacterium]
MSDEIWGSRMIPGDYVSIGATRLYPMTLHRYQRTLVQALGESAEMACGRCFPAGRVVVRALSPGRKPCANCERCAR